MKIILKRIASIICILGIMGVSLEGLQYLLVDDTESYTRIKMHELYNSEDNIDVLFVGSSHVNCSLNPETADALLDKNTFNAGTQGQPMDGSLAMIKEAITYYDIEQIYLEMYYGIALGEERKERTELSNIYLISDYMRPSFRKLEYLLEASSKEYYVNGFIPARREWEKIFDFDYIKNLVAKKNTKTYVEYQGAKSGTSYYLDGFMASEKTMTELWNESACNLINKENISEDWKESLDEIVDLCEKREIELILFAAPMPDMTLIGKENYDEYSGLIRNMAENYGIEYYDFNLCKSEYFDAGNLDIFRDAGHLNLYGVEEFTKIFSGFFAGNIPEKELFFDSYEEKLLSMSPRIYGIGGPRGEEEQVSKVKVLSNRNEGIEYQVTLRTEDDEEWIIKEYSTEKSFDVPMDVKGTLKIEARHIGEGENFQVIEVE